MKNYLVKFVFVYDGKEHTRDEVEKMDTWNVMERRYDNCDDAMLTAIKGMQNIGRVYFDFLYIKRIIVNEIE